MFDMKSNIGMMKSSSIFAADAWLFIFNFVFFRSLYHILLVPKGYKINNRTPAAQKV